MSNKTCKKEERLKVANKEGKCSRCPPHGGENSTQPKRTVKPKKNDHR